uniref:protein SUPPRESSOR OF npr1-1, CONSTITUTIVE 1-like n=1 Tax=Erigeron canadensis TaxID=72917 RepID=UPI001CB8F58B|nr:protein SUPPRESSOR OF npr1-1, CONSTITUTIVE 1-like [Erigeron canadensis]
MSNLVWLIMKYGKIKHLWKTGEKVMLENLKFINLRGCESLKKFPDVSGTPNIEGLDLSNCNYSVGSLKKLVKLDMTTCNNLKRLPSMLQLKSMKTLGLLRNEFLKRLPKFSPCMVSLSMLEIKYCNKIEEVPSSINYLSNLKELYIASCEKLKCLPSMLEMESLEALILSNCSSVKKIPDFSPCMVKLSKLVISDCHKIEEVSSSINHLSNLKILDLSDSYELQDLPYMPDIRSLETLLLRNCHFKTIPMLPPCIDPSDVDMTGCYMLERVPTWMNTP